MHVLLVLGRLRMVGHAARLLLRGSRARLLSKIRRVVSRVLVGEALRGQERKGLRSDVEDAGRILYGEGRQHANLVSPGRNSA